MSTLTLKALVAASLLSCAAAAMAANTIVILRHGEKPEQGLGQLTCQGLNRALALPNVLSSRFDKPVALHAPNPAVKKNDRGTLYPYIRPLATIEPYAIRLQMPVDIDYSMAETKMLAHNILRTPGTHVVVWEHHLAVQLAKDVLEEAGAPDVSIPPWPSDDFDSMFVITVPDPGKGKVSFSIEKEGLNQLPESCPLERR